ncbi:MAG: hypothetical protein LBJ43_00170 [Propionibacteriaceae bacterium]|jgi:hypothetical protein|nr:hypothetical protein [Propionibacteriaceae bacterium]
MAVFSDLNLDGDVPVRVRPDYGEWGSNLIDSTAHKKRHRGYAVIGFVVAVAIIVGVGYFWYRIVMGY